MGEAAPEYDPSDTPLERDLILVRLEAENDGPDGPFFVLDTGERPPINQLAAEISKSADSRDFLYKILVSLGFAEPHDTVREYRQMLEEFSEKTELDDDERQIQEGLHSHIRLADTTNELLNEATTVYRRDYLYGDDFSRLNTDALMDLYDATEEYEDTLLLQTFEQLRTSIPHNQTVLEAERLARIIIRNEVTPTEP